MRRTALLAAVAVCLGGCGAYAVRTRPAEPLLPAAVNAPCSALRHESERRDIAVLDAWEHNRARQAMIAAATADATLIDTTIHRLERVAAREPARIFLKLLRKHRDELLAFPRELPAHLDVPGDPTTRVGGWFLVFREKNLGCEVVAQ